MGIGFNLFLVWARGLSTLLLGDQMVTRWCAWLLVPPDSAGPRLMWCVYVSGSLRRPTPWARSVLWRGDYSECARGVLTLFFSVVWVVLVWEQNTPGFDSQPTAAVTPFLPGIVIPTPHFL